MECDFFRVAQSSGKFCGIGCCDGNDHLISGGSDIFGDGKKHGSCGVPVIACVELPAVVKLQIFPRYTVTVSEPQFKAGVHSPGDFRTL